MNHFFNTIRGLLAGALGGALLTAVVTTVFLIEPLVQNRSGFLGDERDLAVAVIMVFSVAGGACGGIIGAVAGLGTSLHRARRFRVSSPV